VALCAVHVERGIALESVRGSRTGHWPYDAHALLCCFRGSKGTSSNLGGFASVKSFATLQTAMYYTAGSPQVYDSSNLIHKPGSYIGTANDQKLCSTW
jgi:hypothetical protein